MSGAKIASRALHLHMKTDMIQPGQHIHIPQQSQEVDSIIMYRSKKKDLKHMYTKRNIYIKIKKI
jgi:hypothetical protein